MFHQVSFLCGIILKFDIEVWTTENFDDLGSAAPIEFNLAVSELGFNFDRAGQLNFEVCYGLRVNVFCWGRNINFHVARHVFQLSAGTSNIVHNAEVSFKVTDLTSGRYPLWLITFTLNGDILSD